jgi:hypothetical protein
MIGLEKTSQKRRLSLLKLKLTIRMFPLLALVLLAGVRQASAQGVSAYFGLGTLTDSAGTTNNSTAVCPPGQLYDDFNAACEPGPTLGGVFGVFGADFMIKPTFGINAEYTFRFAQAPYLPDAGLNMRPSFYDFNAVWEPTEGAEKRIVPVLVGGVGGARIALYFSQNCSITGINCTSSYPAGFNANHFQVHGGVGVKLYVKGNLFIKPQFDIHYVTNLTDQFGRNWVPQGTISVGYTFGGH